MIISYYLTGNKVPVRLVVNEDGSSNHTMLYDPSNTDYQEYLKWLSESPDNKPLPDEGTV